MFALVIGAVVARYRGEPALAAVYLVAAAVAVPLSVSDVAEHRIPDRIVLPAFALSLALLAVDASRRDTPGAFVRALLCASLLATTAVAAILVCERSLGLGDVKLLAFGAALAGYHGWAPALAGLLVALAGAGVASGALLLAGRLPRGGQMPLAPCAVGGTLLVLLAR